MRNNKRVIKRKETKAPQKQNPPKGYKKIQRIKGAMKAKGLGSRV